MKVIMESELVPSGDGFLDAAVVPHISHRVANLEV